MSKPKRATHVEFQLSRQLTWAEREAFRDIVDSGDVLGYRFLEDGWRVAVYAHEDSRYLYEFIHTYLAVTYANVYLKAIRTVFPRVKV